MINPQLPYEKKPLIWQTRDTQVTIKHILTECKLYETQRLMNNLPSSLIQTRKKLQGYYYSS